MFKSRLIAAPLRPAKMILVLAVSAWAAGCASDDEGNGGGEGASTALDDTSSDGTGAAAAGGFGNDVGPVGTGSMGSGLTAGGGSAAGSGGANSFGTGGSNTGGDGDGDITGDGDSGGTPIDPGEPALGSSAGDGTGCAEDQIVDACGTCDGDGSSCDCFEGELCWDIVFEHNEVRRLINLGQFSGQPAANPPINMVGWDPMIAEKAQEWADSMDDWSVGHSSSEFRTYQSTHYSGYHGENMAIGGGQFADPHEFVYSGWCESEAQGCELKACGGHYTQVVWRESVWIGCGRQDEVPFESGGKMYTGTLTVCEYGPGGNINGRNPY